MIDCRWWFDGSHLICQKTSWRNSSARFHPTTILSSFQPIKGNHATCFNQWTNDSHYTRDAKCCCVFPYVRHDLSLFLFGSLHSLYPHLFSRAYINFKTPEDILLFRDRFDGYVFIDNKGIFFLFYLNSAWLLLPVRWRWRWTHSAACSPVLNANKKHVCFTATGWILWLLEPLLPLLPFDSRSVKWWAASHI